MILDTPPLKCPGNTSIKIPLNIFYLYDLNQASQNQISMKYMLIFSHFLTLNSSDVQQIEAFFKGKEFGSYAL